MPEPVTLLDFAKKAFREGNDKEGFDYLCAHYICNEKDGDDLKGKMKWSTGLKHPVLAVRIGVGITYGAPAGFTGDPQPVGRVKEMSAAGGGGAMPGMPGGGEGRRGKRGGGPGMPGMPGGGMPGGALPGGGMPGMPGMGGGGSSPTDGRGQIDYYTGEFGTKLIESLESRISEGKFGEVLKDFEGPASAGGGGAGRMPGMPGGAGMPGMAGGAGAMPGMPGGMPGAGGGAAAAGNSKDPKGIMPGLVVLGLGGKDSLEKRAKDQNLDLLFIFDVNVKQSAKTDIVNNTTTLRLYVVQKPGEVAFTSTGLNAVGVTKLREKPKDKDPVDTEVERAMVAADKFAVTDIPAALQPEHALQRVTRISGSQESEPLIHLVEIRAFKAMRLISVQQFQDGVKGLIGPEKGETLLKSNKEEDRRAVLASFLPRKTKR
ncbi:MAG: hypothetical protein ACKVP0_01605 [Pirellulaceae bacterium]